MKSRNEMSLHFFNSSVIAWMYSSFISGVSFQDRGKNKCSNLILQSDNSGIKLKMFPPIRLYQNNLRNLLKGGDAEIISRTKKNTQRRVKANDKRRLASQECFER